MNRATPGATKMIVADVMFFGRSELNRLNAVSRVANQPSAIYLDLLVRYDKPPVFEEEYALQDVQGISTYWYRI